MPASPADAERYANRVTPLIDELEAYLFDVIRTALAADQDAPNWALSRLGQLQRIRSTAETATRATMRQVRTLVAEVVLAAYNHGAALALNDLEELSLETTGRDVPAVAVSETLTQVAMGKITDAAAQLPRYLAAAYSEAVAVGALEVAGGSVTRLQAAQHVLDRLLSEGVRGFRDSSGRNWSLDTYVEMAVRTVTGQAAVQGHVDQLQRAGLDLVQVSDSPRECPLCRPWEGKVLSISGQPVTVILPSETGGKARVVTPAGTVAQARAAGLQHPNCTHRLTAYLPGATRKLKPKADPIGYEAKQRQRALERGIRKWKRRENLALTPEAAAQARAKVRQWQAALREHVDANDLKRLRYREQVGTPEAPLAH